MDVKTEEKPVVDTANASDDVVVEKKEEVSTEDKSVEQLLAEVDRLKNINKDVIATRDATKQKLRDLETVNEQKLLEDKGQYEEALKLEKEKYETLNGRLKDQAISNILHTELQATNVLSAETALELIDRSAIVYEDGQVNKETVADAIKTLQEKHKVLFGEVKPAPTPKKAGEEKAEGGYLAELKKIQSNPNATRADLDKLRTKYGK